MSRRHDSSPKPSIQLWPLWVAIGCPLLLIALNSTPVAPNPIFVLIGEPVLLLIWAGVGVCAVILTVRWLWRRAWLQAVVGCLLPFVILGVSLNFYPFIHLCNDGGDIVHFLVMRPSYIKSIRATPANGEPRLLTFNLGGMIWASRGYVYDESDEVVRAPSVQTPAWKARAQNSELACEGYYARPFPGHFAFTRHWYLASFPS